MKRTVILVLVVAVVLAGMLTAALPMAGANEVDGIIYVDASATGANDGVSWEDAFVYLQDGLAGATSGDQIWVAAGTYYPDEGAAQQDGNRTSTFGLVGDVGLYGGFAGFETAREQRDWAANPTVLSGEIQQDGCHGNNTYHVVTGADGATLDGFTITGGYADGSSGDDCGSGMRNFGLDGLQVANCTFYDNYANSDGGGMYNVSVDGLQVTNCTFEGNGATYGGGVYNDSSSPSMSDCTFEGNTAETHGGGVYNDLGCDPQVSDCTFEGNRAGYGGGGMYNQKHSHPALSGCTFRYNYNSAGSYGGGMYNHGSSPTLSGCTFEYNTAEIRGGGMFNWHSSSPTLDGCSFEGNWAEHGGGMANREDSDPQVSGCTFRGNLADYGGGMFNHQSSASLGNCSFEGNRAEADGGGMYNWHSSPMLGNCTFEYNTAETRGGGMYNWYSSPVLGNCTFARNTAAEGNGGGLCNDVESDVVVGNCTFAGNSADGWGGGVYNRRLIRLSDCLFQGNWAMGDGGGYACVNCGTYGNVTNCAFWKNRSYSDGGGIYVGEDSEARVTNCSFNANSAGPLTSEHGGAIYVDKYGWATVTNSIAWGDCPDEVFVDASGSASVYNSDVQGGWAGTGDDNIAVDPMWADPSVGDFHLLPGSQCIDAGNNTAANIPAFDFEGDPRIVDGNGNGTATVDMGVDELLLQSVEVFFDDFEDCSLSNWEQDVQNDWFCSTQRAHEGTHAAEVDGWANDAALTLKEAIDLSGATEATLSFWWYIESRLDDGEYLACDVWNGTAWVEVVLLGGENYTAGHENMWHNGQIQLGDDDIGGDFKLRFRGKMSRYDEDANVDAVQIMATMP